MSAGDKILSATSVFLEGDTGANRAVSEALGQKIGANINQLIDTNVYEYNFAFNGYFGDSRLFRSAPIRIRNTSAIEGYALSIGDTGSSGNTTFNVDIYDDTGSLVDTLFGTGTNRLLISGDGGTDVIVGRDGNTAIDYNASGHTIQYGNKNVVQVVAGQYIVAYIDDFATSARSLNFNLRLRFD